MNAVVNATPLIALSLLRRLDLLPVLFQEVLVPRAVYDEVTVAGSGRPGAVDVAEASWLQVRVPEVAITIEPLLLGLDEGELQVLLLAREVGADWVLIDERLARRVAIAMGLRVKGTAGILAAGYHAGLVSREDVEDAGPRLLAAGIRLGPRVLTWLTRQMAPTDSRSVPPVR